MDMENPRTRISKCSSQGVFSHRCLRKASSADTVITGLGGSSGIAGYVVFPNPIGDGSWRNIYTHNGIWMGESTWVTFFNGYTAVLITNTDWGTPTEWNW